MAENLGQRFEDQFIASIPQGGDVLRYKLHTPAAPAELADKVLKWAQAVTATVGASVPDWVRRFLERSRFVPRQPYDLVIEVPVGDMAAGGRLVDHDGVPYQIRPVTLFSCALELKCAGYARGTPAKSIPLSMLKPHQITSLEKAEANGRVAGVVVEFPPPLPPDGEEIDHSLAEVYFMPASTWAGLARSSGRKSIPVEDFRRLGLRIQVDLSRGRLHRYYRVGDFLRHFGAVVSGE
jgi:hypothetical protein